MERAPGIGEVLLQWTLNPLLLALLAAAVAGYARAFGRARLLGCEHPASRFAIYLGGLAAVFVAVASPVAAYADDLLWVNFTGFLLLTMVAPPLILLGAPLILAFRASGPRGKRILRAIYRSRAVAVLTFPVTTWVTFAVVTYLWQFTPLTELAARNWFARDIQHLSLLFVGLLFWYPALAVDPMRWRLPYPLRALYVLVEMAHKALFGGMFLSMNQAMHSEFAARAPAWAPSPITDQRMAILILWIGGSLIFLVGLISIVSGWIRYEERNQRRVDLRLRREREAAARRRAALEQVFQKPL